MPNPEWVVNAVQVRAKAHVFADTVAWDDKIDIAPEYLYERSSIIKPAP